MLRSVIEGADREHFFTVSLDARGNILGYELVAIGTLDGVDVHPREVFRSAILAGASSIIVGHNHPSGSTEPSPDDVALTRRLRSAGELLGIPLIDHVIVTEHSHVSLDEQGHLK